MFEPGQVTNSAYVLNKDDEAAQEEFDEWMGLALQSLSWSKEHIGVFERSVWPRHGDSYLGESMRPARYIDARGIDIYSLLIQHLLYSAFRSGQAAVNLILDRRFGLGSRPSEQLLRGTIISAAKALYLLFPTSEAERVERTHMMYQHDRYQWDMAKWNQQNVVTGQSGNRPKNPVRSFTETTVLRGVLDQFIDVPGCPLSESGCAIREPDVMRSRLMGWWSHYSAVAHANIWQLESSTVLSPSGQTKTTGDISQACYDIFWLLEQAVLLTIERFTPHVVSVLKHPSGTYEHSPFLATGTMNAPQPVAEIFRRWLPTYD